MPSWQSVAFVNGWLSKTLFFAVPFSSLAVKLAAPIAETIVLKTVLFSEPLFR